jgi:hypothetical protein
MAKKSLEERIQRLEDIHEIQNLMGREQFMHTAGMHRETLELFAQKTPGVRVEVDSWGIYEGTEGIRRVGIGVHGYHEKDHIGSMMMHTLTTPVIEVAGDGKTAKAVWISPGHETMLVEGKLQAYWAWCKYGVDFVKEDGKWKIWHSHVYAIFRCPYETSWVEMPDVPTPPVPDELKPDRPGTYHHPYSTTTAPDYVPAPPEPYETWDEATAYVK